MGIFDFLKKNESKSVLDDAMSAMNSVARTFREMTNMLGVSEIEGIEKISDDRIIEIHDEVVVEFSKMAIEKGEYKALMEIINGIVRDMLIAETFGQYSNSLKNMKDAYEMCGIKCILVKGRTYHNL